MPLFINVFAPSLGGHPSIREPEFLRRLISRLEGCLAAWSALFSAIRHTVLFLNFSPLFRVRVNISFRPNFSPQNLLVCGICGSSCPLPNLTRSFRNSIYQEAVCYKRERRQTKLQGSMEEDIEKMDKKRFRRHFNKADINQCCRTYWLNRFPVITWIRNYSIYFLINDMIAGITVGLTAIPQGVAYAVVAGLAPEYGLYSGYMACFVYFLLGTVKEITIGPTAIMALMVHEHVERYNSDFAVLNCFLAGCIILLLGIFRLGFLVNFISLPVTVGFTTAAALTIASSQLKSLFGLRGKTHEFLPGLISTLQQISKTRFEDLTLGLATITFLVLMKILNEKISRKQRESISSGKPKKFYVGVIRFIALGRNGVVVVIGTILAYVLSLNGPCPFTLTGKVGKGFPQLRPPPFSTYATVNNETVYLSFLDMTKIMSTSIISIPLISVLETIAIGKIFARGSPLDAEQEVIALGMSNILGSFVQSMPTAGSFTRSVVNNASGVKTPLGGIFTGILVLSAFAITSTFEYIPKASLAGVILTAMYYMIKFEDFTFIWRVNKLDMIPLWATILFCLAIRVDVGILLGIIVNLIFILYVNVKPKAVHEELSVLGEEVLLFHLNHTPLYSGAEHIRNLIMKTIRLRNKAVVVIDGSRLITTDSTTVKTFKDMGQILQKETKEYAFWNWPPKCKELYAKVHEEVATHFHNTNTIEELIEIIGLERRVPGDTKDD